MDSIWTRFSNLLTYYCCVLAFCGAYNYLTARWLSTPSSHVHHFKQVQTTPYKFHPVLKGDQYFVKAAFDADLSTSFNWNTHKLFAWLEFDYKLPERPRNEVVVWDHIAWNPRSASITSDLRLSKYIMKDFSGRNVTHLIPVKAKLKYQYIPKTGLFRTVTVGEVDIKLGEYGTTEKRRASQTQPAKVVRPGREDL